MKHIYFLVGEPFLVDEALAKIRSETGSGSLSEVRLDADSAAPEILNALETPTLLGGPRLVIVEEAQGLGKEAVAEIERFIESPSSESVLVLVANRKTALARLVDKKGAVVTLDPPRGR
ncbi:MAG: hypothetical protein M3280_05385, partial [Actinomycetota bacterium]|nr:hypothetical protein [Actinomycetota bacterium]